ncbi:outer membrane protein assembly factor BamD [Thermodesulfobacteriota bacterium]
MNMFLRAIIVSVWLIFMVSFTGGCAAWDSFFFGEEEDIPADQLMKEANEKFDDGEFEEAKKAYQKVKDRYPYSEFALEAELKMADSLYEDELYEEAYDAYDDFEKLHPKNKEIPYVIYKKGMCHFVQVTTIDRDQSHTLKAKEEFERLVKRYPRNEYASSARKKIRKCYINMAEYELYIGHYYYRRGKYRAAMERYRYLIENYPDLGQYKEAVEYYAKAKERIPEEEEAEKKMDSWWYRLTHPY